MALKSYFPPLLLVDICLHIKGEGGQLFKAEKVGGGVKEYLQLEGGIYSLEWSIRKPQFKWNQVLDDIV